jgi:hypothetical protein
MAMQNYFDNPTNVARRAQALQTFIYQVPSVLTKHTLLIYQPGMPAFESYCQQL